LVIFHSFTVVGDPAVESTSDQQRCLLSGVAHTVRRLGATELIGATASRPRALLAATVLAASTPANRLLI
jgi:hypothetical protein